MKPKTFVAFTAVTVVVMVAALAVVATRHWSAPTQTEIQPFPGLMDRLGEVAEITIERSDGTITLERVEDDWQMPEKNGYPVRGDRVRKLAIGLAEMKFTEPKTRKPERYPRLEVEDPEAEDAKSKLVTLKTADGDDLARLIVGRETSVDGARGLYVRLPDRKQAWLAPADLEIGRTVEGWLEEEIMHVDPARIARLTTVQPDGERLVVYRDTPDDPHFKFQDLPEDAVLKGEAAGDDTKSALTAVTLLDVAPESAFDFSGEGVTRAEVATFDGLLVEVAMVEKEGDTWARFTASRAPGASASGGDGSDPLAAEIAEINARVGGWAYKLNTWTARALTAKLADFLEKETYPGPGQG